MKTIENQLSTLKPATQAALAQRILDVSSRRRQCHQQRRRDCFVGLTGLLIGIAATVLVMVFPFAKTEPTTVYVYVPVVQEVAVNQNPLAPLGERARVRGETVAKNPHPNPRQSGSDLPEGEGTTFVAARWSATYPITDRWMLDTDSLDLDVWIARYETLFRHHRELANRNVYVPPVPTPTLPDGMSPLEWRSKLLTELENRS